jgi:drug/metabolite transporter (DMT)-like permease
MILPMFVDPHELVGNIKHTNWANLFSGISIVGIVVGHVLYYRSGWSLSTGTLCSYVTVCILLVPIGLLFFQERINLYNIAGMISSLVGLCLLTKK